MTVNFWPDAPVALRASRTSGSLVTGGGWDVVVGRVVDVVVLVGLVVDVVVLVVVVLVVVVLVVDVVVVFGSKKSIGVKVSWSAFLAPEPA